jgi:hypothetical protein
MLLTAEGRGTNCYQILLRTTGILTTYIPEAYCQPEGPLTCVTVAAALEVVVGAELQAHCQEADQ